MTTPSIDELAKAAVEAAKRAESPRATQFDHGFSHDLENNYFQAIDNFHSAATPEAWLSLSSRVEKARREAIEDVITIMLNAMFTKTHAETLDAIRNLIPGDKS